MPSVLIVDDAVFMRAVLRDILSGGGFEVSGEASGGQEAIDLYREVRPDIVTMDITMPGMDGIEAVRAIIAEEPSARIVMVSAQGQQTMVIQAIVAGAKDFIVKPFQPERVLEAMRKVLGR